MRPTSNFYAISVSKIALPIAFMSQDFSGQNLRGQNFKGRDLTGANFSYTDIRGANFTNAILRSANFTGAKAGLPKRWIVISTILSYILLAIASLFPLAVGYFTFVLLIGFTILSKILEESGINFYISKETGIIFAVIALVELLGGMIFFFSNTLKKVFQIPWLF